MPKTDEERCKDAHHVVRESLSAQLIISRPTSMGYDGLQVFSMKDTVP